MRYIAHLLDQFADGVAIGGGFCMGVYILWHLLMP